MKLALTIKEWFWFLGKQSPAGGRIGPVLAWSLARYCAESNKREAA